MKHNLLKSVIISVILLMGVSNAWAAYYILGPDGSWDQNSTHQMVSSGITNWVYKNLTPSGQWTSFKVYDKDGDKWYGKDSNGNNVAVGVEYTPTTSGGDNYCDFTTNYKNMSYYFFFNTSTKKLMVQPNYYLVGTCGASNQDWGQTQNATTYDATKGYFKWNTCALTANTEYKFKLSGYGAWTYKYEDWNGVTIVNGTKLDTDNDKNIRFKSTYAGTTVITFNPVTNEMVINCPSQISYNKGANGTGTISSGIKTYGMNLTLSSSTFTRTGYTQDGWSTTDGGDKVYDLGGTYTTDKSITLYPHWTANKYTVTLSNQGATTAGTASVQATYDAAMPPATMPTKTGYTFGGYYTSNNGGGTQYYNANGASAKNWAIASNSTLYAKWTATNYTITYNTNGGNSIANKTYTIETATFNLPTPTKTGYTFAGWYTKNDFSDTEVTQIVKGTTGDKTFYAKWTANKYTVTLSNQGATTAGTASVQATYGSAMPSATMPTKTGYTFGGYYTSNNGGGTQYYDANGASAKNWAIASNSTLYAKWTATNYTITYNTNGGNSIAQKTYTIETATFALPTPTKTGHTFAGWYDNANLTGNKVTQVAKGSTGNKTFYAAWTINQYTLTYSAGEGGTVSGSHASGTKIDYNTSVTLTATPAEGNILSQWVDENGTFVSSANPYTFNITQNTTLKAEFAPPTTVYLKPVDWWPNDGARFAIYTWGAAGKTDRWVEMQPVDCENQYYSANIPSGYTNFKYIRLNPAGKDDASKNDGLHWDYKWGETGDLTLQGEDKNLYTTPRIYLKPNANWKTNGARFAAYFFKKDGETTHEYWMSMYKDGDYYYCNIPTNNPSYDQVIFCRMNPSEAEDKWDNKWNQTNDLKLPTTGDNLYTVAEGAWSNGSGSWSTHFETFAPTYTVTLKSSSYGLYNVSINGQTHHSNYKTDVVVENVPLGAQVEVYNVMPHNPEVYNEDIIVKRSSNANDERYTDNKTFTVCGNTTIAEDFVTKEAHTLYLGVPDALITATTQWNLQKFIWTKNGSGDQPLIESTQSFKIGTVTYYEITIPAGYNKFCFQSKQQAGSGPTECQSIWFYRSISTNNVNCFTLKNEKDGSGYYKGDWSQLPAAEGDFRVLYVEQEVANGKGSDSWKTVINTTYQHSSDIIKKRTATGTDIVSLHINYDETKHPRIILQQMSSGEWVDVEGQAHMVLGPLTASADMAMLPGRRNAEGDANLRYDDGIEEIKADAEENGKAGRVWNFVVRQSDASAYIDFTDNAFAPYTGDYYIRTDNAIGGWICYNQSKNVMSHSLYSLEHSGYSHYFCKWVEIAAGTPNVKFVVANQYGTAISDTIASDKYTDENGTLEADANVRWMWNEYTNIGSRAYIAGSKVSNFLVAKYAASSTKTFEDKGEWVYEVDLTVKIDDKLTSIAATYAAQVQELLEKSHVDAGGLVMLASAGNDARVSSYTVRIVYDFKINQTICYLIPTGTAVATSIDVIIERINQDEAGQATQVTAAITPANAEGLTVYGLITLTKAHITGPSKSEQEALTYWISFPFDVKIGDITGFGEVGKHWMIKYYDGAERAAKGWFLDTKTFWKFFLDTEDVMKANTGYVLTLNKSLLNASNPVYDNTETLRLYFPSMNKITTEINSGYRQDTVHITEHWCNITTPADRSTKDSHWNMIGVPSFANQTITTDNETVKYFYDYSHKDDKYNTAKNAGNKTFKPMHAYMVQFAGVIDWKSQKFDEAQQQLAAKKNADAEEQYTLRLELQQNGTKADQTFVELHDDATTMFDMNIDLTKMFNAGANIYTIIPTDIDPVQAAANVMPIANTVIPVGVQIAKAGEYTFAMPEGTDGIVVELIDYETNTTTNLMLDEYTVNLAAGTNESRFALSVKPDKTTTSLEDININSNGVKKYLIDGVLYLQKDGVLYDAQGKLVR